MLSGTTAANFLNMSTMCFSIFGCANIYYINNFISNAFKLNWIYTSIPYMNHEHSHSTQPSVFLPCFAWPIKDLQLACMQHLCFSVTVLFLQIMIWLKFLLSKGPAKHKKAVWSVILSPTKWHLNWTICVLSFNITVIFPVCSLS